MGTTTPAALIAIAACVAFAGSARAESCTGISSAGERFAQCFDLGNRLSITAGTTGFGGSIAIRHDIHFDDEPDLVWKMQHTLLQARHAGFSDRFTGLVYGGRYLRHARDGHIMLPFGNPPQKVFLPFDIGALIEVGSLRWRPGSTAMLGVIKTAALVDISRSRDFRQRFAFGPVASWDVELSRSPVSAVEHDVSPFSSLLADLHLESANGLTVGDFRAEAGLVWHSFKGAWVMQSRAEASLERIVLAINDRPIALFADVRYESASAETIAGLGVRIVLFDRIDPRVSLNPPVAH